jgi:hypothetical protein
MKSANVIKKRETVKLKPRFDFHLHLERDLLIATKSHEPDIKQTNKVACFTVSNLKHVVLKSIFFFVSPIMFRENFFCIIFVI